MSKKLISLVLAVAMVMSMFCIIASADEVETAVKPTLTYYFLAPDDFGGAGAYWWEDGGCGADWPGVAMTAVPEIGKNVYSVEVSALVGTIIFNENVNGGQQTVNLGITEETTGKKNVANKIFVAMGKQEDNGQLTGEWFSLNPNDSDYYRVASSYAITGDTEQQFYPEYDAEIVAGEDFKAPATATYYFFAPDSYAEAEEAYSYENDVKVPEVPTWTPAAVSGEVPGEDTDTETGDEPSEDEVTGTFFFKVDGTLFSLDSMRIEFYVWDGNGNWCSKDGWNTSNNWGSKKLAGKPVDGSDDLVESYPITLKKGQTVQMIVHDATTNEQTVDMILTEDAFGDTLVLTGESAENTVDSEKKSWLAAFEKTDKCGPSLVITSTGKVQGTVAVEGTDYAELLAQKIAENYTDTENWTRETVVAIEDKIGVTDADVTAKLEAIVSAANGDDDDTNDYDDAAVEAMRALLGSDAPASGDGDAAAPYAYWWEAGGCGADWPGVQMEACPTIGKHVYKISGVSLEVVTIIFNNGNHELQTKNLNIEKDTTGFNNVNNKIFVITEKEDTKEADGVWMSLDPRDDDYYRNALKPEDDNTDSDAVETPETPETPDPTKDTDSDNTDSDAVETPETPETPDPTKDTDSDNTDSDNTDSDNTDSDAVETPETPETPDPTKDSDTDTSGDDTDTSGDDTDTSGDDTDTSGDDTDTSGDDTDTDPEKPDDKTKKAKMGDVNLDGVIDSADALAILMDSVDQAPTGTYVEQLADVDGDKSVTANDAMFVLRYSVGMSADGVGVEVDIPA